MPVAMTADLIEVRSIDGSGNNLSQPARGSAGTPYIRITYPHVYPGDGTGATMLAPPARPNPRTISNEILAQSTSLPNSRGLSDFVWVWGQFLDHDLSQAEASAQEETANITIDDPADPLGPSPIPFSRSNYVMAESGHGAGVGRQQINEITSFIDASNVYGSDAARANALRSFSGGKLVTSPGGLPGLNTGGFPNQGGTGDQLFLAGDARANEHVGLGAMHTVFVREHNRLAEKILQQEPDATDEQVYQKARKLVGAEMQIVTYKEFLPALMGAQNAPKAEDAHYNDGVTASITQTFATALYRFGHSMVSPSLALVEDSGSQVGSLSVSDAFFNPELLTDDSNNVDRLLKGFATQLSQERDAKVVDGLRNFLFGPPGAGGLDLAALNIQRGRDHGLPNYNLARFSYDLSPVSRFDQITSDVSLQNKLREVYGSVGAIDLWVAGLAENSLTGSSVGPLMNAVLRNQFTRLRDGDRFFYLNDPDLYDEVGDLLLNVKDIIDLNSLTLSSIIEANTGLTSLQENVFFVSSDGDFDGDGVVSGSDFLIWQRQFGKTVDPMGSGADGNVNGVVETADLSTWLQRFGISDSAAGQLVPEPGAGSLVTWCAAGVCAASRSKSLHRKKTRIIPKS